MIETLKLWHELVENSDSQGLEGLLNEEVP